MKLIGRCSHPGEEFVSSLTVFGLLIGAADFEICVLYPDFSVGQGSGSGFPPFTMVFRTSRESLRFRLVGDSYEYMKHGAADSFCCEGLAVTKRAVGALLSSQ